MTLSKTSKGAQSFALALYVLTGATVFSSPALSAEADCRVYCRALASEADQSVRYLKEEQRAIQEARASGLRAIISPIA